MTNGYPRGHVLVVVALVTAACAPGEVHRMQEKPGAPRSDPASGSPGGGPDLHGAVEALRRSDAPEDAAALRSALAGTGFRRELRCAAEVTCLAVDAAGRTVATGSFDGCARIWPGDGGDPVTLPGHGGFVSALAFAAGDGRVATGDRDGVVRIWSAAGALRRRLDMPDTLVRHLAFAADGSLVAVCVMGSVHRIPAEGAPERLRAAAAPVAAVAEAPDETGLALGMEGGDLVLVRLPSGEEVRLAPQAGSVGSLAFAGDARRLLVGGGTGAPRLLDLAAGGVELPFGDGASGAAVAVLPGTGRPVAVTPEGVLLIPRAGAEAARSVATGFAARFLRVDGSGDLAAVYGHGVGTRIVRLADGATFAFAALRRSERPYLYDWSFRDVRFLADGRIVGAWGGDSAWVFDPGGDPASVESDLRDLGTEELLRLADAVAGPRPDAPPPPRGQSR